MITGKTRVRQADWRPALAGAIRDPADLWQELALDPAHLPMVRQAAARFPLRVPRRFLARIQPGDPADPLLRQVMPLADELDTVPGFVADPLDEQGTQVAPGVLHKYPGRALLIVTGACAIHCRYCFRREFPYADAHAGRDHWQPALAYLAGDASLREVILSGGDPLMLSNRRLDELLTGLEQIPHLQRLRLHTRIPVALPERMDSGLLERFARLRQRLVVVIHANHAREIDDAVRTGLAKLAAAGAMVLNQTVLLRGINDAPETLAALSETLFNAGVLPYYLHLLDPVRGAAHFAVTESSALAIMHELRQRLPGYLVPRLVREHPGELAKTPVESRLNA